MAIKSLVSRVRQHDWLAVGIELLVVVAGVFIALQVTNWNDERKEAARGREYLERLHDDLALDIANLDATAAFWNHVRDYGVGAIAYAERGTLVQGSAWKTLLAYYQASQVWPYRKHDVTFQEIKSSGDLLLIRDAALRAHIATHYSASAGSQVVEVLGLIPRYREHVRGMTPWGIQQYIWARCYRSESTHQFLLDCESPISEAEALAVIENYRRSTELTEELRFWMVNVSGGLMLMQGIRSQAEGLSSALERELGR